MLAESPKPATAATPEPAAAGSPSVLVVIPARNRREMTLQAVRSVLSQQVAGLRCLVVDDASTDGTADAVRALRDERAQVLVNPVAAGGAAEPLARPSRHRAPRSRVAVTMPPTGTRFSTAEA